MLKLKTGSNTGSESDTLPRHPTSQAKIADQVARRPDSISG